MFLNKVRYIILALTFNLLSHTVLAEKMDRPYESFTGCGVYLMAATIWSNNEGYSLVVNEGTRSEYQFKIPLSQELKVVPYVKKPIKLTGEILQFDGT